MSHKKNKRKKRKPASVDKKSTKKNFSPNRSSTDTGSELTEAVQYHQSGQLHKAGNIYKKILEADPKHSDSLHLSGVIALQTGKYDIAVNLIQKAIQCNPGNPIYYNNLGTAFKDQGKLIEAISCFQKALEIRPNLAEAHYNLGTAFKDRGKLTEAVSYFQKALEIRPGYAEAYNNMGNVFKDRGELGKAISSFQKALEIRPDYAKACYNLGIAFKDQGKLAEAIASYEKAIQIKPDYAEVYNNLGTAFKDQGKLTEAISSYQKALEIRPGLAEAYYNLGIIYKDQGRLADSISSCQKALEIKPDYAETYNNMGTAFTDQGKLAEAVSCFKKALETKPDLAEAYYNLGTAFTGQGKIVEAISSYRKALEIKPDYAKAYSELFHQLQQTCAWQELEGMTAKLDDFTTKALDNGTRTPEPPFVSITRHTGLSRTLAIAKSWSDDIAGDATTRKTHFSFDGRRSGKTKITIGYLSNDFQNHAMSHLTLGLYGLHNREEFEIFCYSYGEDDGSCYRTRIRQDCDKFVDIRNLGHADAARCIYEDQVDILVDLKGYTRGCRIEISALRPAPVQVRYLGMPCSTGADFFDYFITDRIAMPEDHAKYYSENFVYMPHCYQINDHTQAISDKDWKKPDFGLPVDSFVFCSFNQGYKIEPVMFNTWMDILRQVPESVLWLQRGNEITENNLRLEAERRDVKPARLIFSEKLLKDLHLGRLKLVDLALDTRIVNGAITTSDALWAGVPVITLQGGNFASRLSSSILAAIGLPELTTKTLEEYESLAIDMARNPDKLQMLRQKTMKNRLVGPLFDTPGFTKNLEKAYKEMWKIFVAGERPRQIKMVKSHNAPQKGAA